MDDQQLHEKIEAYLLRQMSAEEAATFEADMAADPVLTERVALQRLALRAAERLAQQSLQEKFARWRVEEEAAPDPPPAHAPKTKPWFWVAALLLLLAGAFWIWKSWADRRPNDPGKPAENEMQRFDTIPMGPDTTPAKKEALPLPPDTAVARRQIASAELEIYGKKTFAAIIRGNGDPESPEDVLLTQADSLLNINKYQSAAKLLEKIPPGSPFRPAALKRLAFARHKLGQPAQAIAAYENYAALAPANEEEHDWALCLYYLADSPRHEKQFRAKLRKILASPAHEYHDKATALARGLR